MLSKYAVVAELSLAAFAALQPVRASEPRVCTGGISTAPG